MQRCWANGNHAYAASACVYLANARCTGPRAHVLGHVLDLGQQHAPKLRYQIPTNALAWMKASNLATSLSLV